MPFKASFVGDAPDCADHVEAWSLTLGPELVNHRPRHALGLGEFVNCVGLVAHVAISLWRRAGNKNADSPR